jgi:hypothetical protein
MILHMQETPLEQIHTFTAEFFGHRGGKAINVSEERAVCFFSSDVTKYGVGGFMKEYNSQLQIVSYWS